MLNNVKRFFCPCELLEGNLIFDSYGLDIKSKPKLNHQKSKNMSIGNLLYKQEQEGPKLLRDPYKVKKLFDELKIQ